MLPPYLIYAHKTILFNLIVLSLLLTSILSLITNDLMIIWFLMEINSFMFMIYLCSHMNNKKIIFLNFFIQVLSSSIMMISIIIFTFINQTNDYINTYFLSSSLILKLGVPPLHFWLPIMSIYMPWVTLMIFLTIQKIIPFILISMINLSPPLLSISIILCMFIPPFLMINSTNIKKLLAFSSINQSGWLILLISLTVSIWMIYMFIYTISFLILIKIINKNKINFKISIINKSYKLIFLFIMMNIAGLPPFSLFIIKWYSMLMFMNLENLYTMSTIMLLSSLMMMYMYINMLFKFSLIFPTSKILMQNYSEDPSSNKNPIPLLMIITLTLSPFFILM